MSEHAFKDGAKPPLYDLSVTGQWGLYEIFTPTTRGKRWVKKNVEADRIELGGAVVVEGGDRCRDIVAGAVKEGLRVEVNGLDMKGFRAA